MFGRLQVRSATASEWSGLNPTLAQGEIGHIQPDDGGEPYSLKIGDGVTPWNDLPTITGGGGSGGEVTSDDITDATEIGKDVLTATDDADVRGIIGAAAASHNHDERYYTQSQTDGLLDGKPNPGDIPTRTDDLLDISDEAPEDGDVRFYNASLDEWVPGTPPVPTGVAADDITGTFNLEQVAPGTVIVIDKNRGVYGEEGEWPVTRPTSRTDVVCDWQGDTDPGVIAIAADKWTRTT